MVDFEEFELCFCYIMMDIELFGIVILSSLCSILELEIRGNENCLERDLK